MSTLIIAEAGSCHDGDLIKALQLVDVASHAGADAVKFQYWSSPERLAERRHAPDYLDTYSKYAMPVEWLPVLKMRADQRGIEFMCTTYLPEDIATVAPFVKRFKISSFESIDREFVWQHIDYGKLIIVSVGMQGYDEIERLRDSTSAPMMFLHCVSAYPAPFQDFNLAVIRDCCLAGFSDHSGQVRTGAYAVMAGATIIEVHFKLLNTFLVNPDAGLHALRPEELKEYVFDVRQAEVMLGDGNKRLMESERAMEKYQVKA